MVISPQIWGFLSLATSSPPSSQARNRITSYNVCYTKLLRSQSTDTCYIDAVTCCCTSNLGYCASLRIYGQCARRINITQYNTVRIRQRNIDTAGIYRTCEIISSVIQGDIAGCSKTARARYVNVRITSYNVCYTKLLRDRN